jgi:hypothetical protein
MNNGYMGLDEKTMESNLPRMYSLLPLLSMAADMAPYPFTHPVKEEGRLEKPSKRRENCPEPYLQSNTRN